MSQKIENEMEEIFVRKTTKEIIIVDNTKSQECESGNHC